MDGSISSRLSCYLFIRYIVTLSLVKNWVFTRAIQDTEGKFSSDVNTLNGLNF